MNATSRALQRVLASLASGAATKTDDAQLIERFLTRRAAAAEHARTADRAFEELVVRHGSAVREVCLRMLDDPGDVEDVFQATFLVLFRRAGSFRVGSSLGPWLCGVARRIALRVKSDRARRSARESQAARQAGRDPASEASRAEIQALINEEVSALPERYRDPVMLCLVEGLTYDEAARRLACPTATLGVRLARGRAMLRKRLKRRGVAPASAGIALSLAVEQEERAARFVRGAMDANYVASPRVADLARTEIRCVLAMKLGIGAAILSAVLAMVGSVAHVMASSVVAESSAMAAVSAAGDSEEKAAPKTDVELPADVKALVDKHEEHLKRILSLKCLIDMLVSDDGGETWKPMGQTKYCRNGLNERIHHQQFLTRDRDKIVRSEGHTDVLFTMDGIRSLSGFDPTHPPAEPLTPIDQAAAGAGRLSGMMRAPEPAGPGGFKGGLAADHQMLLLPDPRYSLRQLCEATPKVAIESRTDAAGQSLRELKLKSPDHKIDYVVTVAPDRGYSIVEVTSVQTINGAAATRRHRVVEFQEPARGVFLPKILRQSMSFAPRIVIESVVREVVLNGGQTPPDLEFRFPQGLGIFDMANNVWYVWGKEVPLRTFRSPQEFNEWTANQLNSGTPSKTSGSITTNAAEQYEAVARELEAKTRMYIGVSRRAMTDMERLDIRQRHRPNNSAYAFRFLEMAKANPDAPTSLYALARAATLDESTLSGPVLSKQPIPRPFFEAVKLLREKWTDKPAIAEVLLPIALSLQFSPEMESLLREVIARNPSRDAKAHATVGLASLLFSLSEVERFHAQGPNAASELELLYGKKVLDQILSRHSALLSREASMLMHRVAADYADVKLHLDRPKDTQTLGNFARAWLGMEEEPILDRPAPEIEGKDLNGTTVKLSDYRGKVVVVVFWASWCAPCMAMLPEENALVRKLAGKPVVFLGVNGDATAAAAKKVIDNHSITWPTVHDGLTSEGKIAERYKVAGHGIPAIFVIDRQGVLRHKFVRSIEELSKLIDGM
jgi:RNA polymerase sigma factor (sigma-70 family)